MPRTLVADEQEEELTLEVEKGAAERLVVTFFIAFTYGVPNLSCDANMLKNYRTFLPLFN